MAFLLGSAIGSQIGPLYRLKSLSYPSIDAIHHFPCGCKCFDFELIDGYVFLNVAYFADAATDEPRNFRRLL